MFPREPFRTYLKLLFKWNRTYNLTAITDPLEIEIKHFEDSLAPLPFLPASARVLDIGTGAGFPGIPLKIARSDLEIVLLDAQRKKIAFCETMIRELKLQGVIAVQGRAEEKKMQTRLGLFDVVVSRATFPLTRLLKVASPYLGPNGIVIAMKGKNWEEEWKPIAGWELIQVESYSLRNKLGERVLLLFKRKPASK